MFSFFKTPRGGCNYSSYVKCERTSALPDACGGSPTLSSGTASSRYALISPCRNESAFLQHTLESVIAQSVRPTLWVIVDDGSTDTTPQMLAAYAKQHQWIRIVTRPDRGHRAVGPGVVDAFYCGYNTLDTKQFEFICKLDLDLQLPPRYFEILIRRMDADPNLASCSGKSWIQQNGKLVPERHGDETSLGMTKFYRLEAFEQIGGFVREVMWDGIDCHESRRRGWKVRSWDDADLRFVHLRPMGSSQESVYTGRMRHGYGQYFMGTGALYMAVSALSRVNQKPYLLGSLAMFWGWLRSAITGAPRYGDTKFRAYLRRYQLRALTKGKARAIAEIDAASERCRSARRRS